MLRRQLKFQAKGLIATAKPKPLVTSLIYILVVLLVSMLSTQLILTFQQSDDPFGELSKSMTSVLKQSEAATDEELLEELLSNPTVQANIEKIADGVAAFFASPIAIILYLALDFVSGMLSIGFNIFALNTTTKTAQYSDLLGSFSFILRLIGYYILRTVLLFFWTLLLIVPGIIAAYRYRMSFYLLVEHPEYSVMQCFRESSKMMRGNKMELFVMDLSFIGWTMLISMLGCLGYAVQVWFLPYYTLTNVLYYRHLSGTGYREPTQPVIEI